MFQFFAKAAIAASAAIVFALARRYAQVSKMPEFATAMASFSELQAPFKTIQWFVGAGMVVVGIVIFVSLHQILISTNQYLASLDGPAEFVLLPQAAIWYFLPGFAAVTLTWDVTLWVWSTFGSRHRAAFYEHWSNTQVGFNATRVLRIMALVLLLPVAVMTSLALPEHASLRAGEIRSRGYGVSKTNIFAYADARLLIVTDGFKNRDGVLVRRAACILYFSGGRKWSSAIGDFRPSVDPSLLRFLETKTGLSAEYSMTAPEVGSER